jgi:hypothetical protein
MSKCFTDLTSGDIWGGLAASAVDLPQTMAFGIDIINTIWF